MSAWNSAVAQMPIAVAVAHRDPLVQAGLQATLMSEQDFAVSILSTGSFSLRAPADVVVADYETALELFSSLPPKAPGQSSRNASVMVVSHRDRETEIRTALDLGVRGYLLLGCAVEEMICCVRARTLARTEAAAVARRAGLISPLGGGQRQAEGDHRAARRVGFGPEGIFRNRFDGVAKQVHQHLLQLDAIAQRLAAAHQRQAQHRARAGLYQVGIGGKRAGLARVVDQHMAAGKA
ncbi:MAG: hypothetical protein RR311_06935 [Comamonas sp.]